MPPLSDVWLLLDNSQMTSSFSIGNWVTSLSGGAWLGSTAITIGSPGGNIVVSFQGTSISFAGNTPSSSNSPTWFLVGIDLNSPYNVSFPNPGILQSYTQWYQTPTLPDGLHTVNLSSIVVNLDYAIITAGATTPLSGSTIVVDDESPEILYNGNGWKTSDSGIDIGGGWVNGLPLANTTHRTSNMGDGFSFQFAGKSKLCSESQNFNLVVGSNISVYGVFEWTATGSVGVDFTLDGVTTSSSLFVPVGSTISHPEIPNYLHFSSGTLKTGNHTLIMSITESDGNQSFVLDYLTYEPSFSSLVEKPNFTSPASPVASGSEISPSASNTGSPVAMTHKRNIRAILGGAIGGGFRRQIGSSALKESPSVTIYQRPLKSTKIHTSHITQSVTKSLSDPGLEAPPPPYDKLN
ncbi:uncharacterized protein C8R40DRAFT_1167586 [Lentinula edodes]|uniref:uncharacterized protein n=1 Tax=Lentinula edodes TaxID=5353 RepID=UPI001E8E8AF0|nr:uncharacterized protein C8R40DRAFT_1167586 [Lentinula edodes]KAH7878180.1 hypothetical protein C8R40DRAFT_1167586 [Lentinula edodes]